MKSEITITWTDGKFEKSWTANSIEEAQEIAKDSAYWPIEITDYSTMQAIITEDGNEIHVMDYLELHNKKSADLIQTKRSKFFLRYSSEGMTRTFDTKDEALEFAKSNDITIKNL